MHEEGLGSDPRRRIGVLISGRGSNLQALIDAVGDGRLDAQIAVVISNKAGRPAWTGRARRASRQSSSTIAGTPRATTTTARWRKALQRAARLSRVPCGFMRLVGAPLLDAFPNAILNVHPSLLPAFPGVDAQRQALEHGVEITGATVHLVTGELDGGPIVRQSAVPVRDDDTVDMLSARILIEEHRIYPEAVRILLDGRWRVEGRRFRLSTRAPD